MPAVSFLVMSFSLLTLTVHISSNEGPTREDLEHLYENKPGFPCYYDGAICEFGQQFCSRKTGSCENIFQKKNLTKDEKLKFCLELPQKNDTETEKGQLDGCVYFRGLYTTTNDVAYKCATSLEDNTTNTAASKQEPGKELCSTGLECRVDSEICNPTTRMCEALFTREADSYGEKWRQCELFLMTQPDRYKIACMYVLGRRSTGEKFGKCGPSRHELTALGLGLGLGFGIPLFIVFIVAIVILMLLLRRYNWLCFQKNKNYRVSAQETKTPETMPTHSPLLPAPTVEDQNIFNMVVTRRMDALNALEVTQ